MIPLRVVPAWEGLLPQDQGAVAVVGSRYPTTYGKIAAEKIAFGPGKTRDHGRERSGPGGRLRRPSGCSRFRGKDHRGSRMRDRSHLSPRKRGSFRAGGRTGSGDFGISFEDPAGQRPFPDPQPDYQRDFLGSGRGRSHPAKRLADYGAVCLGARKRGIRSSREMWIRPEAKEPTG